MAAPLLWSVPSLLANWMMIDGGFLGLLVLDVYAPDAFSLLRLGQEIADHICDMSDIFGEDEELLGHEDEEVAGTAKDEDGEEISKSESAFQGPSALHKRPISGFFLFCNRWRENGGSCNTKEVTDAWQNLGPAGQKKYVDEAKATVAS